MISVGFSLFISGLAEIFLNFKKTLIICVPWILLLGGLTWYVSENPGPVGIALWIANWLVLPGVAVPWHRHMLLESIDPGRENAGIEVFFSYLIKWFVMSLILGLLGLLLVFMFGSSAAILMGVPTGIGDAMSQVQAAPFSEENRSITVALTAAFGLAIFVVVYLAHRLGYILPHVSVSEEPSGYFDAFMKTAPLSWPLVVVAFLVTIAIVVSIGIASFPYLLLGAAGFPDMFGPIPTALVLATYQALILVLQTLVGASIQTEIYRIADGIAEEERALHVGMRIS